MYSWAVVGSAAAPSIEQAAPSLDASVAGEVKPERLPVRRVEPFDTRRTVRLLLRCPESDDLEAILEYWSDPEVHRFLRHPPSDVVAETGVHLPDISDLEHNVERVRRIELPYSAWEADVLPLNYTRRRWDCSDLERQKPPGGHHEADA